MKHGKSIMWGLVALLCVCVVLYAAVQYLHAVSGVQGRWG